MTLARERAVATMFLLGGDEDLREGVVAAQEMGVLVVVVGVPTAGQGNQARTLTREADEHVVLDAASLAPYFFRNDTPFPAPVPALRTSGTKSQSDIARDIGEHFARDWAARATRDEIRLLVGQAPVIPRPLDLQLISAAEMTLGLLRERQDLKKDLRSAFWRALQILEDREHPGVGTPPSSTA
jgi:hypothetical protein